MGSETPVDSGSQNCTTHKKSISLMCTFNVAVDMNLIDRKSSDHRIEKRVPSNKKNWGERRRLVRFFHMGRYLGSMLVIYCNIINYHKLSSLK